MSPTNEKVMAKWIANTLDIERIPEQKKVAFLSME
jgi:hypothetical protein